MMGATRLQVELDVFSGRPNPTWLLDELESAAVLRHVRPGPPRQARWPGLGYRGFIVRRMERPGLAIPWLRVGGGLVIEEGGRAQAHVDEGGLEALLAEQARARSFGELVRCVR